MSRDNGFVQSTAPQYPVPTERHNAHKMGAGRGVTNKKAISLSHTDKLALDTQNMEERLHALRAEMARQKQLRATPDAVWRSGQPQKGSLSTYGNEVLAKKNASLQRARYTGAAQEAENRVKQLERTLQSQVPTAAQLQQQYAGQVTPAPQDHARPLYPRPQPPSISQNTRPPARMWRVPSALGTHDPPQTNSSSSPSKPNPYLASQPLDASLPRRSSEFHPQHRRLYDASRRASDATVVAIPPTPPRDTESARDYIIFAAEEGRNDPTIGYGSPLLDTSSPSVEVKRKPSLLDGAFNEEESHRSFVEALEEWRNAGKRSVNKHEPAGNSRVTVAAISPTAAKQTGIGDDDDGNDDMTLPTYHQPRARAGSLVSLGKSLSSLTTSLGAALGISNTQLTDNRSTSKSMSDLNHSNTSPQHRLHLEGLGNMERTPASTPHLYSQNADQGAHASRSEGQYDEEESHRSFLAALNQWRGARSSARVAESSASNAAPSIATSTDPPSRSLPPAAESAFAQSSAGLTYMERLLLEKFRKMGKDATADGDTPERSADETPDLESGDTQWQGDEIVFIDDYNEEVPGSEQPTAERKESERWSDDEDDIAAVPVSATSRRGSLISFPWPFSTKRPSSGNVTIEDVTKDEDGAVMSSGTPVEVVGSDRLIVQEPEN